MHYVEVEVTERRGRGLSTHSLTSNKVAVLEGTYAKLLTETGASIYLLPNAVA